jgi:hypothetical protein
MRSNHRCPLSCSMDGTLREDLNLDASSESH